MSILPKDVRDRVASSGLRPQVIEALAGQLAAGVDLAAANIIDGEIIPPPTGAWLDFSSSAADHATWHRRGMEHLRAGHLGLLVLNGGMATRFGNVVKGTVTVDGSTSFIGWKLKDALAVARRAGAEPPIVILMNSEATHSATMEHLDVHNFFGYPKERLWTFRQCWSVRFTPDGSLYRDQDGSVSYHGPGHGDVITCLKDSGLLERFRSLGGRQLLLSNVDNIVAKVDPALFGAHLDHDQAISVELVDRWEGDQGGAPYVVDGRLQIVESFRLPAALEVAGVPVFNTNTFWLDVEALRTPVALTWFAVTKNLGGSDVIQFERLVGEITGHIESKFIRVPRSGAASRFIPIKTPVDLERSRAAMLEAMNTTWERT